MKYDHLYKDYISTIEYKIDYCTNKIYNFTNTRDYVLNIIKENEQYLKEYDIDLNSLLCNPLTAYSKVSNLCKGGQLTKVADAIKALSNVTRLIQQYTLILNRLRNCVIPYIIYITILDSMNSEISKIVLEGEIVNYGRIGNLAIIEVPNNLGITGTTSRVDWDNTNKLKKKYEEQGIDLYNKEYNPEGTKYFQYHANDYDYWWCWVARGLKNRMFYKFIPNNYYHRFDSKKIHLKQYNSKEEIYKDSIGNAEKMRFLVKFDNLLYLAYRRNYEAINVNRSINILQIQDYD
jgi:hypothetical protein